MASMKYGLSRSLSLQRGARESAESGSQLELLRKPFGISSPTFYSQLMLRANERAPIRQGH